MEDKTLYTADSIESLSPREFTRLRPGVYCGSTQYSTQLVIELVSNALDEHNLGHGNHIWVDIDDNNIITVRDEGQGFPICEERDDGKTVLQASFDQMNTSGKYSEDGVYGGTSLGLNGIGGKLANFLSKEFSVISWKGKNAEAVYFKDGIFQERKTKGLELPSTASGTEIVFVPDPQFFTYAQPNLTELEHLFDDICGLCPELHIVLNGKDFYHPEGLKYLVSKSLGKDDPICSDACYVEAKDGSYSLECGITYSDKSYTNMSAYVNYGLTDAGPHITAIKSCLTRVLNKWGREQGLLKKKDKNLDGASLQEGLVLVFNLIAPNISYDAQTKSRIVNNDFVPFLNDVVSKQFEYWLDSHVADGKAILEKAILAKKAADAAKKARENVKNKTKKKKKKVQILHPDRLKDAEFLGDDSVLLIVEG